jgi:hypothetical protein
VGPIDFLSFEFRVSSQEFDVGRGTLRAFSRWISVGERETRDARQVASGKYLGSDVGREMFDVAVTGGFEKREGGAKKRS